MTRLERWLFSPPHPNTHDPVDLVRAWCASGVACILLASLPAQLQWLAQSKHHVPAELVLPADPGLAGASVHAQALVLDVIRIADARLTNVVSDRITH